MNWTSTKVPLWESDCEYFRRVGRPFQIKHVRPEHWEFVKEFSAKHGIRYERDRETVTFHPRIECSGI